MPYAKRNENQRKAQWKEKRCPTATLLTLGNLRINSHCTRLLAAVPDAPNKKRAKELIRQR